MRPFVVKFVVVLILSLLSDFFSIDRFFFCFVLFLPVAIKLLFEDFFFPEVSDNVTRMDFYECS